jgi:hypothetical protein
MYIHIRHENQAYISKGNEQRKMLQSQIKELIKLHTPAYGTNLGILVISLGPSVYTLAPMKINLDTCDHQENIATNERSLSTKRLKKFTPSIPKQVPL